MSGRVGFCNSAFVQGLYGAQPVAKPRDSKRKQLKEEKKAARIDNDIKETLGQRECAGRSPYSRVKQSAAEIMLTVEGRKGRNRMTKNLPQRLGREFHIACSCKIRTISYNSRSIIPFDLVFLAFLRSWFLDYMMSGLSEDHHRCGYCLCTGAALSLP
jgi:hypothetical protein